MTLASFFSWADRFESYLVETPEDRFCRDEAQLFKAVITPPAVPAFLNSWRISVPVQWPCSRDGRRGMSNQCELQQNPTGVALPSEFLEVVPSEQVAARKKIEVVSSEQVAARKKIEVVSSEQVAARKKIEVVPSEQVAARKKIKFEF